jgi:tetratricopeptide (TPR) repeat protein
MHAFFMRSEIFSTSSRSSLMSIGTVALLLLLGFLIWNSFAIASASLYTAYGERTARLDAINLAVKLNPTDPEPHYARSSILVNDDPATANAESTQAVTLRPRDYIFWLGLAQTRERNNELTGGVDAAREAVRLAPSYSQPRWRLGNLLVRAGRFEEGFNELRLAGASNPALLPSIIDLAWHLSQEDLEYVKRVVQPDTTEARIALSDYFRTHGKFAEAAEALSGTGPGANEYRGRLLNELVSHKRFSEAYELWLPTHATAQKNAVFDPSFEQGSNFSEPGFGWRVLTSPRVAIAIDDQTAADGKGSLKIDFNGEADANLVLLSQLVMVEANARYTLKFAGRSDKLVSGGLPVLRVIDASSGTVLGESVLPQQTNGWAEYSLELGIPADGSTIEIRLQRQNCTTGPCPIFGALWLDNFSLQRR